MARSVGAQCRLAEAGGRTRLRALQRSLALSSSLPSHFLRSVPLASSRFRLAFRRAPSGSHGTSIYPSARRAALHFPCRRSPLPASFHSSHPSPSRSLPPSLSYAATARATRMRYAGRARARAATHERNFAPRSAPLRFAPSRASRRRHRAMRSRTPWATLRRRESANVVLSVRPPSPEDAPADRLSRLYALHGTLGRRRFAA